MREILNALLFFCIVAPFQKTSSDLDGTYANEDQDLRVVIKGDMYHSYRGRPIFQPKEQRHVDFELGLPVLSKGKLVLECQTVFYSPNRLSLYDLYGHSMYPAYKEIYKTEAERKSFLKQLNWRAIWGGPKHRVEVKRENGQPMLIYEDIPLHKVSHPDPNY